MAEDAAPEEQRTGGVPTVSTTTEGRARSCRAEAAVPPSPTQPGRETPCFTLHVQNVFGGAGAQGTTVEQNIGVPVTAAGDGAAVLADYLAAARRAARDRPYAGVLPDVTPPAMAEVYVHQRMKPQHLPTVGSRQSIESAAVPAEEVLGQGGNCLIIGAPGCGKSSLLRTLVAAVATSHGEGEAGGSRAEAETVPLAKGTVELPVLVPAVDLLGDEPLPTLLTRRVKALLKGGGLRQEVPADFFRTEPVPGARWLLLVDGLDEVADVEARRTLVRELLALTEQTSTPRYRFVATSRPLPGTEVDIPGHAVSRFELQPFDPGQVSLFADRWLRVLGVPQATEQTASFMAAVRRAGLEDVVRTPLMATMLCQLYAADTGDELPAGRAMVFARFVDLLRQRHVGRGDGTLDAQTRRAWENRGPAAMAAVERTVTHVSDLIGHLASARLRGDARAAVSVLTGHPAAAAPQGIPRDMWAGFLADVLRRSGLLVEHGGDFDFWHRTLLEFLAAEHDTADAERREALYADLFCCFRRVRPWSRRTWSPPDAEASYVSFVVGLSACHEPGLDSTLLRLAENGGLLGAAFLSGVARYGERLPAPVERVVVHQLQLAVGNRRLTDYSRSVAAGLVTDFDHASGTEHLRALAFDREIAPLIRFLTAAELRRWHADDGLLALVQLASERHDHYVVRALTGRVLAALGHPAGVVLLDELAEEDDADFFDRLHAIRARSSQDDREAIEMMMAFVADSDHSLFERTTAASALIEAGHDYRGFLVDVVEDEEADSLTRGNAAAELYRFGDHGMADVLVDIALDSRGSAVERRWAVERLAALGDPRSTELYVDSDSSEPVPSVEQTVWQILLGETMEEVARFQRFGL